MNSEGKCEEQQQHRMALTLFWRFALLFVFQAFVLQVTLNDNINKIRRKKNTSIIIRTLISIAKKRQLLYSIFIYFWTFQAVIGWPFRLIRILRITFAL